MALVRPVQVVPVRVRPLTVSPAQTDRNPYGASVTVVTDTFTRADSTTLLGNADSGEAWTALSGTWGINTNRGYIATDSGAADNHAILDSAKADCTVSVTFTVYSGDMRVIVRATDNNNLYFARSSGGNVELFERNAAVNTQQGASVPHVWASGDVLSVAMNGGTITVSVNGVLHIGPITDVFNQTATKHGMGAAGGADVSIRYDNFSVTVP